MGVGQQPKTRPGVTGFVQEYNQEGPKTSDLNPDVVTDSSVLPTPLAPPKSPKAARVAKPRKSKR
jgi:hypothetical protein